MNTKIFQEYGDPSGDQGPLFVTPTALRSHPMYQRVYMLGANCTVMVLVPLALLITMNYKIYRAIKNREKFR